MLFYSTHKSNTRQNADKNYPCKENNHRKPVLCGSPAEPEKQIANEQIIVGIISKAISNDKDLNQDDIEKLKEIKKQLQEI